MSSDKARTLAKPSTLWSRSVGVVVCLVGIAAVGVAASALAVAPLMAMNVLASAAMEPSFLYADSVVVVLADGTELSGELIEDNEQGVKIKTPFGVTTIERARIKELRTLENPFRAEFDKRAAAARRKKSAEDLVTLAEWASEKGFGDERTELLEDAIRLESDHEGARRLLGHARLDGAWVEASRVADLIEQGYRLDGLTLVAPATPGKPGDTATGTGGADAAEDRAGRTAVGRPAEEELTEQDKVRFEREQKKREAKLEKERRKRELEIEGVPWSKAYEINAGFCNVVCNSTRDVAKTYGGILKEIYRALKSFMPGNFKRPGKPTVFVYKTQDEFMGRTGMPQNVGGFYQPANEQVHAYHGGFGTTGSTLKVLAHEVTHQFQGKLLGGTQMRWFPKWVIEGMAVYLGDGSKLDYKKKKLVIHLIPRDRLYHIQRKMKSKDHSPLRELCMLDRGFTWSHYADAWSLLYFLFQGPEKDKGRLFFQEYWSRGVQRPIKRSDFDDLAEKYFENIDSLEKQWVEFTLGLAPESAGEVTGDEWFSDEFCCELRLPWDKWVWNLVGEDSSVLVALEVPETSVSADLRFFNNNDQQEVRTFFDENLKKGLFRRGKNFKYADFTLSSLNGLHVTFDLPPKRSAGETDEGEDAEGAQEGEGKEGKEGGGDGTQVQQGEEEKKADPAPPKKGRKCEVFLVVSVTSAYGIICQANDDEWKEWRPDFERLARSFSISTDFRRW